MWISPSLYLIHMIKSVSMLILIQRVTLILPQIRSAQRSGHCLIVNILLTVVI